MLAKISDLFKTLNKDGIRYCHWKSNLALADSLAGQTDVDLLIHREDAIQFRSILSQLRFKPATIDAVEAFPSVEHHFVLDQESGVLVHVHTYYRVITGESLTKNYRLPIEEMLLDNTREVDSIRVPTKSAELVVFTLRILLKHTSLVELALLSRYWKDVRQEMIWLLEPDSLDETEDFVKQWLPLLDADLFSECMAALIAETPLSHRIHLGHRLRSQLRPYARHSAIRVVLGGFHKFAVMGFRRLTGSKLGMVSQSGGAVIAFVGSEATGKSTLLAEMRRSLGEHFEVEQIHAGKPKSTILAAIPNLLVPALRSMFPKYRSTHLEAKLVSEEQSAIARTDYPLMFAVRSVLLAYDRRSLLTRAYRKAANGTIVLCDRYPSTQSGAPDSPQLTHLSVSANRRSIRHRLAKIEERLYREIPPPDLIIYLSAPLDVTISRNATRGKREPEDYVRRRHARSTSLDFGRTPVYRINTDQSLDLTVHEVKNAVWNLL